MPDVAIISDPFAKPSPDKEIAKIFYAERPIKIELPQLGKKFFYQGINDGNDYEGEAKNGEFSVFPGVYLLSPDKGKIAEVSQDIKSYDELKRFVAPSQSGTNSVVIHNPARYIDKNGNLVISAEIIGSNVPEQVTVYPQHVSFWNENN